MGTSHANVVITWRIAPGNVMPGISPSSALTAHLDYAD